MLDYYVSQVKVWAEKFGLKYVDRVDAKTDSPQAGAEAASALLAKNREVEVLFPAADTLALGAATAAKAAGIDELKIVSIGGSAAAYEAIKNGSITATSYIDAQELHRQLVWAAYDTLTHQGGTLPKEIVLDDGQIITKDNVDQAPPPAG